ncbi:hypothetical protein ABT095_34505 [Kitasatospora sp. NPDC002227]|uniref:hypothetical protein n=1 Tax=Kitasatospora sp. NPDC002227 TaxID=3154773 RepID=UPI0033306C44
MPGNQQPRLPGLEDIEHLVFPDHEPNASIQTRFEAFHALNPWVLRELERRTAECVDNGWQRISIGMLFELLRYRYGQATRGDEFRLNNNWRSRYVRLLLERHPNWEPLFETRALRAA